MSTDFEEVALLARMHHLARTGHIPFPGSLTVWTEFLGTQDISSLLQSGTDEPCNRRNC